MSLETPKKHGNETNAEKSKTMSGLGDYEDLGVSVLEDDHVSKRCRYLNSNCSIWPMGYGLITSIYKYRHKVPVVQKNYFDSLPEEVVLHVFKKLDKRTLTKCAFVCHKWRRIAYDESLWHRLNIPCRRMSIMALDNLLRRNIKFLSVSHANLYIDPGNSNGFFVMPLPKLQYLDLSAAFIPVNVLSSLLNRCANLVKLSVENCSVDEACCRSIANNTKLRILNLASTNGLNIRGLEHILSLKNLEELNLSWAHVKADEVRYLASNMIPNLKRLNVSGFLKKLEDSDLMSLVHRCPRLIELDISDSLSITSRSLDFILHNQPDLKVLSMSRCYNVGSAFLQPNSLKMKMGNNNRGLKELNLFGITNQQLFDALCACLIEFDINKSAFSSVARPKPADNDHTVWEIPIKIDC